MFASKFKFADSVFHSFIAKNDYASVHIFLSMYIAPEGTILMYGIFFTTMQNHL